MVNGKINLLILITFTILTFLIGRYSDGGLGNQELRYGDTGLPKNCRALITANIKGFYDEIYSADEAINSIDRNCGRYGHIWNEK